MVLPNYVKKYFWGDDLSDLTLLKHKKYIILTLLEKGDRPAVSWLFSIINRQEIQEFLPSLKMQKKSSNFWRTYLG